MIILVVGCKKNAWYVLLKAMIVKVPCPMMVAPKQLAKNDNQKNRWFEKQNVKTRPVQPMHHRLLCVPRRPRLTITPPFLVKPCTLYFVKYRHSQSYLPPRRLMLPPAMASATLISPAWNKRGTPYLSP